MNVFVMSTVDIKLISHIDIYFTIQLNVNLMLRNLMYVHEINTKNTTFDAFLSMAFCISGLMSMVYINYPSTID